MITSTLTRDTSTDTAGTVRRATWRRSHMAALIGLALLQALVRAENPAGQDAYWSARYGLDVIRSGHLPRVDTYSWTAHGAEWVPSSWLWDVLLGGGYDLMGLAWFWVVGAGVSVLTALTFGALARRVGARPLPALAVYAPVGMLAVAAIPRAQALSNVAAIVVAMLAVCVLESRGRVAIRWTVLLCATQLLWMNLHSMALLGPVVVAVTGGAVLLGRRSAGWQQLRRLGALCLLAGLCCLATPYGVAPLTHAAEVRSASVGLVIEWLPIGFGSTAQVAGLVGVVAGFGLAWRAWRGRRYALAGLTLVLAIATVSAIRFLPMLGVAAAPELALAVGSLRVRERFLRTATWVVAGILAALAVLGWRDLTAFEPLVSPRLVAAIPSGCRLLNDDLVGDAVVLARPDVAVSLDGRNDVYGRDRVESVLRMFAADPGTFAAVDRDRVGCVLAPTSTALVERLRLDPAWRIAGQDAVRTLLIRTGQS